MIKKMNNLFLKKIQNIEYWEFIFNCVLENKLSKEKPKYGKKLRIFKYIYDNEIVLKLIFEG